MSQTIRQQTPSTKCLDEREFAQLYVRWYQTLRAVAAAQAGPDAAEDVLQQAAIIAMSRLDRFTPGTDFRAWMSAIVRGAAKNSRRAERRHKSKHQRAATYTPQPHLHQDSYSPSQEAIDRNVRDALGELSERQRECFLLRVISGHGYREIAEIVQINEATARSDVHRARRKLAEQFTSKPLDSPMDGDNKHV